MFSAKSLATDGKYLFLHCSRGLYKIGSGCFGTEKGRIYAYNSTFFTEKKVWIGWASVRKYSSFGKNIELEFARANNHVLTWHCLHFAV